MRCYRIIRNFARGATFDCLLWSKTVTALLCKPYLKNYFKSNRGIAPSRKYEIGINVSSSDLAVNDGKSFSQALYR